MSEEAVQGVVSPYRVCPIGAHVDHQHGPVLGMAIGVGTTLAFVPSRDAGCRFTSAGFAGEAVFAVDRAAEGRRDDWTRYPRAAAFALRDRLPPRPRGIDAHLEGALAGGGLSSSASLLLACLTALAEANDLQLAAQEQIRCSCQAENEFVGLASGVLDPAVIVASRRGRLTVVDTRELRWETVPPGPAAPPYRIVVAFSGRTRNLTETGFNRRVEECAAAAEMVAARAGLPAVERLGDLPETALEAHLEALPPVERRRARHFCEERARVRAGVEHWRRGDLSAFGAAMTASCRSSIVNFESGTAELVALHELLQEGGAFGSRFSGAGFAGCVIGLVASERAEACRAHVEEEFARRHPERAVAARVFLTDGDDGLRLL
jgi:galactokinase/galacturonokinase